MHQGCPLLPDPALDEFVQRVLANDELVESYFHAKAPRLPRGVTRPTPRAWMPYTEAARAALQAQSTNLLQPAERSLAYLAALLYPCGLFHSRHPVFRPLGRNFMPDRSYARQVSCRLLEPALGLLADRDRQAGHLAPDSQGEADGYLRGTPAARLGRQSDEGAT